MKPLTLFLVPVLAVLCTGCNQGTPERPEKPRIAAIIPGDPGVNAPTVLGFKATKEQDIAALNYRRAIGRAIGLQDKELLEFSHSKATKEQDIVDLNYLRAIGAQDKEILELLHNRYQDSGGRWLCGNSIGLAEQLDWLSSRRLELGR